MWSASKPPSSSNSHPSPYEVHIELDHRIYNPGDVVCGQVLLNLERPLACDQIIARLYGSARVFFTELMKTPGPHFGKTRAFEQEQVLLDQQVDLWTAEGERGSGGLNGPMEDAKRKPGKSLDEIVRLSNPNAIRMGPRQNTAEQNGCCSSNTGLPVGRHQFQFAFKLPFDGLHTSFDARNSAGSVRYYILLLAQNNGFNCLRRKLLFPVVCPKRLDDPNLMATALEPVQERGSDKKDLLKVELNMEKRGFVPGEPLCGTIKIENNSGKSVKFMSLRIMQHTICFASRPEFGTHQSQFETSAMGLPVSKIQTGHSMSIPIRYFVPALVPQCCVPGCIESEHLLCLDVANKRGTTVELRTPLLIGTHPTPHHQRPPPPPLLMDEENMFGDEKVICPSQQQQGPPPSYGDVLLEENIPPPSYAQSVAGLSAMNEPGDGGGDGQQGRQYGGPICYHYNFGYNLEGEEEKEEDEEGAIKTING